jgi:aryl-alcohol dehydrogenase-like predicted oxidoreductase
MQQVEIGDDRVRLTVSGLCLGTMYFGYRTDEETAFAILDRFREAGGTFLDTANNYGQWHGEAGESERVIGRWLRSRKAAADMVIATKVGARTTVPGDPDSRHWQGLGGDTIRADAQTSLRNLGIDRIDLYYAHIDDRSTPLAETVGAFGELARAGTVRLLGASNTATWRIERARALAEAAGVPAYSCVQEEYTYLLPHPGPGQVSIAGEELLDYAAAEQLTVLAYSPLLAGAYARPHQPVRAAYDHAGNEPRRAALRTVAAELGVTQNQVVLAWLMHRRQPRVIPIPGASSVEQLDEILAASELKLDPDVVDGLDTAGRPA